MTSESPPAAAGPTARALRKQLQLNRIQRLATALLLTALAILLLSARYESLWPWLRWVRAFAEASAIGAIADWYAVVALFRRPLGLPIPHTAVIPMNKDSIGEGLGEFVTQYLFTPENVVGKLERFDTSRQVAGWLATPANANRIAAALLKAVPGFLRAPDDADIRHFFQQHVAPRLLDVNAAKILGKLLELMVGAGLHRPALEKTLGLLDRWLMANAELIREKFAQASKYTPAALDAYIVKKFLQGFRTLVHEVASDPEHPLRREAEAALRSFIGELDRSTRYRDTARAWLQELMRQWMRDEDFRHLRDTAAARLEADLARDDSTMRQSLAALIMALAEGVLRDPVVLERLNRAWLRLARTVTLKYRGQISTLIADVLKSWDANEISRKVQLEIGKDLQFIRINGALVGGVVGIALHAVTLLGS
jgi:uncharacterized membrane-anchored protein YjiN (DUF445 family)